MKKLLAILLCVILTLSFTACGEKPGNDQPTDDGPFKPTKDITYVVPFDAGGNTDVPARILAKYMSQYSDVEIKVTNIVGAGGRTGAEEVKKSKPDGYTFLHQPVAYPMQKALGIANFTYEDFEPVGLWLDSAMAVVVKADSKYETLSDLVEAARANPGKIKAGNVTGTLPLFAFIDLQIRENIEFNIVDLNSAQKAPELLGGRIDSYIDGFGAVKPFIDSGDFRCLALISDKKIDGYDIATYEELGYEDYEYLKQSHGVWAPKGTSESAVEYFNALMKKALDDPKCVEELKKLGYDTYYLSVKDYTDFMAATYKSFDEVASKMVG